MKKSAVIFVLYFLVLSALQADDAKSRWLMDLGQCRPEFDKETSFWGYDCTYIPEGASKSEAIQIKIHPQFSFATPFIDGRAKVLLGCRLASCRHEPNERHYDKRLYVFIDKDYSFTPSGPYDPNIWNPDNYAIYNEEFKQVGHFSRDYASLACVSYRGMVGHINTDGNVLFLERKDGMLSVPLNSQLRGFLSENNLAFTTSEDMAIVERSEELLDFLLDHFEPPLTPVKASYFSSK